MDPGEPDVERGINRWETEGHEPGDTGKEDRADGGREGEGLSSCLGLWVRALL